MFAVGATLRFDLRVGTTGNCHSAVVSASGATTCRQHAGGRCQSSRRNERRQHQEQQRDGHGTAHANREIIDQKPEHRSRLVVGGAGLQACIWKVTS